MTYRQEPPNCIQIELTEGCNLGCSFCGLQAIRDNGANGPEGLHGKASLQKYLTVENARMIASRIAWAISDHGWNPRIEMAMHGEPTMNPDYIEIVRIFREFLPRTHLQMTSNGGGLLKGAGFATNINALMEAGLNVLALDNYDGIRIVDKIINGYNGPYPVRKYPEDHAANPHRRRKPSDHDIVVVFDVEKASDGNHSVIYNHAGASFPPNDKAAGKRCAKPFRELSIRWDGNVAMCCNDWPGIYKIGNAIDETLENLWQSAGFMAARRALLHGRRDLEPCRGCDYLSYRPGLLPDRMGKLSLPEPDEESWAVWREAISGEPYTPRVKRPWDKE